MIVGPDRPDDAGVYKISDQLALIQTVDFFTPIVDNPYWFGQIAAANALSDVYAMGGVPKTAMNLIAFPAKSMDISVLREILQGGLDKMTEAEVVLVGGHSVEDDEMKYGLSVTGFIHPDKVLTKMDFQIGDLLILTKPLGTGIINTTIKGGMASDQLIQSVTRLMATLNKQAAEVMADFPVHACTDVTGFGLLGHLAEMVQKSGRGARISAASVPIIKEAAEYAGMGLVPAGAHNNRQFREPMIDMDPSVDPVMRDILYDPQTSGGLLICVAPKHAQALVTRLKEAGVDAATVIGEMTDVPKERIVVERQDEGLRT